MNLILYKHYNKNTSNSLIQSDMGNDENDHIIGFVSGDKDIMEVLKELIKTKYTV